jgi:hypothetical protein
VSVTATSSIPRQRRTRGGVPLPRIDGRKPSARRFRALALAYESELGGVGLSESDKALIAQVCGIQLRLEELQAATVAGRDVSADEIIRLSSEHRRLLTSLRRTAAKNKPAGPGLQNYILEKYGASESTEETEDAEA